MSLDKGLLRSLVASWPLTAGTLTLHLEVQAAGAWSPVSDRRVSGIGLLTTFGSLDAGTYRVVAAGADGTTRTSRSVTLT